MPLERVRRYDDGAFASPVKTANGYLRCDALITRTGVFEYRLADGSTRRELRLPGEVFHGDSLATFDLVPLTNEHPAEKLTPDNTAKYQTGAVSAVRRVDNAVAASVLVTDARAISDVEAGKTQLSCGYDCDLEQRAGVTDGIDGVPDGMRYDAIQRNIVGNHVAIVRKGRAGDAQLHLDADDAVMAATVEPSGHALAQPGATQMKLKIDGVDYELDEQAGQAVTKVLAKLDEGAAQIERLATQVTEQTARADAADEALEAEKKARADEATPERVRELVSARVALETTAAKILGSETKLDELDDDSVRRAVVVKVSPSAEARVAECDASYLAARYDAAVETWEAEQKAKPKPSHAVRGATQTQRQDSASARQAMIERNRKLGVDPIRATPLPEN